MTDKCKECCEPGHSDECGMNRYGLDIHYLKKNLEILIRDIGNYKPEEMHMALSRLADTTVNSFAICGKCGGHKTHSLKHDASRWFCEECDNSYLLKEA